MGATRRGSTVFAPSRGQLVYSKPARRRIITPGHTVHVPDEYHDALHPHNGMQSEDRWFYKTRCSTQIQGPIPTYTMRQWWKSGKLDKTIMLQFGHLHSDDIDDADEAFFENQNPGAAAQEKSSAERWEAVSKGEEHWKPVSQFYKDERHAFLTAPIGWEHVQIRKPKSAAAEKQTEKPGAGGGTSPAPKSVGFAGKDGVVPLYLEFAVGDVDPVVADVNATLRGVGRTAGLARAGTGALDVVGSGGVRVSAIDVGGGLVQSPVLRASATTGVSAPVVAGPGSPAVQRVSTRGGGVVDVIQTPQHLRGLLQRKGSTIPHNARDRHVHEKRHGNRGKHAVAKHGAAPSPGNDPPSLRGEDVRQDGAAEGHAEDGAVMGGGAGEPHVHHQEAGSSSSPAAGNSSDRAAKTAQVGAAPDDDSIGPPSEESVAPNHDVAAHFEFHSDQTSATE